MTCSLSKNNTDMHSPQLKSKEESFSMVYNYNLVDADTQQTMIVKLIPANVDEHYLLLHNWMNQNHVKKYWGKGWSEKRIKSYLKKKTESYYHVFIVLIDEQPVAYTELYALRDEPKGETPQYSENDWGWRFLIGPPDFIGCGLSKAIGHSVMSYLFKMKRAQNIFCKPDIKNKKMIKFTKGINHKNLGSVHQDNKIVALMKSSYNNYKNINLQALTYKHPNQMLHA